MTNENEALPWHQKARPRRVLTLSNDARLRELLSRGLTRRDFEVVADETSDVDAVLLEVAGGAARRGLNTLRELRERGISAPVVCLVAPADAALFERSAEEPTPDAVLIKPIDLAELASELARVTGTEARW